MFNSLAIYKAARALGSTKTMAEVEATLAGIDRVGKENAHKARFRVEVWDKVSPINGVPAEYFLGVPTEQYPEPRKDLPPGGEMFLVYVDGNLQYIQPHDPDQAGFVPMTSTQAADKGQSMVGRMVEAQVDAEVLQDALMQLL